MHLIDIDNYPLLDIDNTKPIEYVISDKKYELIEWSELAYNFKLYSFLDSYISFEVECDYNYSDWLGLIVYKLI